MILKKIHLKQSNKKRLVVNKRFTPIHVALENGNFIRYLVKELYTDTNRKNKR